MPKIFVIACLIALGGCSTTPIGSGTKVTVLKDTSLPVPSGADQKSPDRPFYVGPLDKLKITVFGVEDLEQEVQVDGAGQFTFPFVGIVDASGLTLDQVRGDLQRRLSRFVRDPQVAVNLMAATSQVVTVDGSVKEPGVYPVAGDMTLVRAVAAAGGTSDMASLDDVVVFRKVNGQRYAALYNLKAIRRGNYDDPAIYPNDVVVVSESTARKIFRDVVAALPVLTTPIVVLANN